MRCNKTLLQYIIVAHHDCIALNWHMITRKIAALNEISAYERSWGYSRQIEGNLFKIKNNCRLTAGKYWNM